MAENLSETIVLGGEVAGRERQGPEPELTAA